MAVLTHLNIKNSEVLSPALSLFEKYSMSGLTANLVSIGSSSTDPPRGCLDLTSSNSLSGFFESTSAGGRSTIIIKNKASEWHVRAENDGSLFLGTSANTGTVCIPGTLSAPTFSSSSQWTSLTNCIYYCQANGNVAIGTCVPQAGVILRSASAGQAISRISDLTNLIDVDIKAGSVSGFIGTTTNHGLQIGTNNTARICIDNAGKINTACELTISHSSQISIGSVTPLLQVHGLDNEARIGGVRWSNDTNAFALHLAHSRGTSKGSNVILQNNDAIGYISFLAANGTNFDYAAQIAAEVDGTPAATNDMPGRLIFKTATDGSSTLSTKMCISNAGLVTILCNLCTVGAITAGGAITSTGDITINNSSLCFKCLLSAAGTYIGDIGYGACDDTGTTQGYGHFSACIMSGVAGAECGTIFFCTTVAGAGVGKLRLDPLAVCVIGALCSTGAITAGGVIGVVCQNAQVSICNNDSTNGRTMSILFASLCVEGGCTNIGKISAVACCSCALCSVGGLSFRVGCGDNCLWSVFDISVACVTSVLPWCTSSNVCVGGTLGKAAGSFVINHVCENKEIPNKYNAMNLIHGFEEGPKYGIFYEGEAKLCNGIALVKLPEYFDKLVNRNDGMFIQLTNTSEYAPLIVWKKENCKVCGNCFYVCTIESGEKEAEFDWRLSATRGDEYVVKDGTQTDSEGKLIVTQWKSYEQIKEVDDVLKSLTKEELQNWLDYQHRLKNIDKEDKVHNINGKTVDEILDEKSIWEDIKENVVDEEGKQTEKVIKRIRKANQISSKIIEEQLVN